MKIAARDTDGLLFALEDESEADALREVLARFQTLSVDSASEFFSIDGEYACWPLFGLVNGAKRYSLFTRETDGSLREVVKFTEHALAGSVVDPPRLAGRDESRKHLWARSVAVEAIERALAAETHPPGSTFAADWDERGEPPFPVIARLQVSTPDQVAELAPRLRLKPFGCYLRADLDPAFSRGEALVTLDPGSDCSEWQSLDWRDVDGGVVPVTTIPGVHGVVLSTLAAKARRWLRPRPWIAPGPVSVQITRRVGRAGPVLDAQAVEPESDVSGLRVSYDEEGLARDIQQLALVYGPRDFARATGLSRSAASRLARAKKPNLPTALRALAGLSVPKNERSCAAPECNSPVLRLGARFCSERCRERERGRQRRARYLDRG